ncbi:MAG: HAMP domain-containing histidine kinase [Pyrinomonadaceae bacterium]|nr:HAMP domain-containing histidine kinase [Pyrinomonadaceae bacterium]
MMMKGTRANKSGWLLIVCIALMLVMCVAAVLQYRWINRASEADRRQQREYVEAAIRNFSDDFAERIHYPLPYFRPSPTVPADTAFEPYLSNLFLQWRSTAERPQMLSSVSFAVENKDGVPFKRLRSTDKQFTEESWPESLKLFRTILENRLRMPGGEPPLFPNGFALAVAAERPVLVFPLVVNREPPPPPQPDAPTPSANDAPQENAPQGRMPPFGTDPRLLLQQLRPAPPDGLVRVPQLKGWCFLEFDLSYMESYLLPELIERHFGHEPLNDYSLAIVTGRPARFIYKSDARAGEDLIRNSDAEIVIFSPHLQPGRPPHGPPPPPPPPPQGAEQQQRQPGPPPADMRPPPPEGPPPPAPFAGARRPPPGNLQAKAENYDPDSWRLVLKSKSGSPYALIDQSRRRNLALSFGILLLLAGSTVMLALAARRARALAEQQMEFVAGVSHELRTPLTVIQSTSYNLSKGMIQDPARVEKYGLVIQKEARRLINQIERMLSFAGIQSGHKLYELRPVDVREIIDGAFDDYRAAFEEGGWSVEKNVEDNLPQVLADAQALESAVENLLENALKYGATGKWLKVTATSAQTRKGREVQIRVADHGPGIAQSDLPHIFEPFYRGGGFSSSTIHGSGLGLCLVDRHMRAQHGSVTVKSSAKEGTVFTLHLPAIETSKNISDA